MFENRARTMLKWLLAPQRTTVRVEFSAIKHQPGVEFSAIKHQPGVEFSAIEHGLGSSAIKRRIEFSAIKRRIRGQRNKEQQSQKSSAQSHRNAIVEPWD